ncbi:MAG: DUF5671 domain-containing protein [bacterium]
MGPEFFFPALFIILAISFVALVALGVAAMHDARQTSVGRTTIVRRGYIYLVSFVTLLFIGAALVSLLDLGMRAWVFRSADPFMGYFASPPPSLYLEPMKTTEAPVGPETLSCANGCTLTDQQKSNIGSWRQNYQQWQETSGTTVKRAQAIITPLSFLIVALVVFLFHWRLVVRDRKTLEEGNNLTRSTHFTAMGFVWLLTSVIAAGFLVNTLLRMAIPGAETGMGKSATVPIEVSSQERKGVESIVTCGSACGLSSETISLAASWKGDYDLWQTRNSASSSSRTRQNALSFELSFLIIAMPLFWYHMRTAWREKKQHNG